MSDQDIELWVYHRAAHEEPIEQAYKAFTAKMAQIDSPLGFRGLDLPPAPNCEEQLRCSVEFEHPSIPDLKFQIAYIDRSPAYKYKDRSRFDDVFRIGFKAPNAKLDYKKILREEFSKVIEAFQAYRAIVGFGDYDGLYRGGYERKNPIFNELQKSGLDMDGRDNIFTIQPAQFWDTQLCTQALGYEPSEVISRLQGKVPEIERLMDGVYIVFNDDPDITYEDFVEMNNRIKPMLDLR